MKPKYRKAVFIVTYAKEHSLKKNPRQENENKNKIYYLILKRKLHWKGWEFPKGGISFFETKKHAVKRELKEETGLKPLFIKKFDVHGKYKYNKGYKDRPGIIGQTYYLYAVKVKKQKIKLDKKEHSDYRWLNFKEAHQKLTWKNQKECLKVVNSINNKNL